ncbi:MAG TPA: cytochrome c oxidase assembly protein [Hyphomicrobiales bacterium]|nr:cytochrome c oxidase assembly protein [Hyphomicrobiales bacterium]
MDAIARDTSTARGEAITLAAVLLAGAVLSWASARYPAQLPGWAPWDFSWVEYLGCLLPVVWYARGVLRLAPDQRPPLWRQLSFWLGMAGIYAVVQTRFSYIALHLFAATQTQQFMLHDIGPFLVALAWPGEALAAGMPAVLLGLLKTRPVQAVLDVVQQPLIAGGLFILLLVLQVVPPVVFWVMIDWRFYDAMNVVMAVDGILFWSLVLDPRPRPPARISFFGRMALAFFAMLPVMPLGAFIAFTHLDLYSYYEFCGRISSAITALQDQQYGGLILWIPGGFMGLAAVMVALNYMRLADESAERSASRTMITVGELTIDPSAWTGR